MPDNLSPGNSAVGETVVPVALPWTQLEAAHDHPLADADATGDIDAKVTPLGNLSNLMPTGVVVEVESRETLVTENQTIPVAPASIGDTTPTRTSSFGGGTASTTTGASVGGAEAWATSAAIGGTASVNARAVAVNFFRRLMTSTPFPSNR
jgi:hypothetical protein